MERPLLAPATKRFRYVTIDSTSQCPVFDKAIYEKLAALDNNLTLSSDRAPLSCILLTRSPDECWREDMAIKMSVIAMRAGTELQQGNSQTPP